MKKQGFTLIEIMIVVAIIGILAAIAIPRFAQYSHDGRIHSCSANISTINSQWETKFVDTGAYGTLAALVADTDYFPDGEPLCDFGDDYEDTDGDNRVDDHAH